MYTKKNIWNRQIHIPQKIADNIIFTIMCLFSLQIFIGLTATIATNDDTVSIFLKKSNLVRGLGWFSLLFAFLFYFLNSKYSLAKTIQNMFKSKPWNLFLFLLLLWAIAMHFHAPRTYVSIFGDPVRYEGIVGYFAYAGYFALVSQLTNPKLIIKWMQFTLFFSSTLNIISLLCLWNPNKYILSYMGTITGGFSSTFANSNHYGYFLCMMCLLSAGLFLYSKNITSYIFCGLAFSINYFTLIQSHTRGGLLATLYTLLLLSLFALIRKDVKPTFLLIFWGIVIIISLLSKNTFTSLVLRTNTDFITVLTCKDADSAGSQRIGIWKATLEIIKEHPFWGCGTDMASYFLEKKGISKQMPHNEYLQHAANLGIPGIFFYLGTLISLFIDYLRKLKTMSPLTLTAGCAVIAYAISAFFGVTITLILPYFYIFLALTKPHPVQS